MRLRPGDQRVSVLSSFEVTDFTCVRISVDLTHLPVSSGRGLKVSGRSLGFRVRFARMNFRLAVCLDVEVRSGVFCLLKAQPAAVSAEKHRVLCAYSEDSCRKKALKP